MPCFAVSANLTRATLVVDQRGPAWEAIRASISLPGVMPAVCRGGDLIVDGGIMNNLPILVMAERIGGGVHVAIDLEPAVDLQVQQPFPSALSGWSVAAQRLNPFTTSPAIPGPLEVLLRSRAVSSRSVLREKLETIAVDLYLAPPVAECDPLDFNVAPEASSVATTTRSANWRTSTPASSEPCWATTRRHRPDDRVTTTGRDVTPAVVLAQRSR